MAENRTPSAAQGRRWRIRRWPRGHTFWNIDTPWRSLDFYERDGICGVVGLAAAVSLVPVALYAGALWWLLSLVVAMAALAYLWRPA